MRKIIYVLISGLICFQSCGQQKFDGSLNAVRSDLQDIYKDAGKAHNIRSLLVSHHDTVIAEAYFDRYVTDSLDHVRSVTKSVMSTLIGIAIDKGIISGLDEPISEHLGKAAIGKEKITIAHLLSMTSGISWNEGANAAGYGAWVSSPNELQYVLDKPLVAEPGTIWNYNSGGIHVLSAILTEASGMSTLEFARKYLFAPIGIQKVKWEEHKDGYYNGGAGLELRPRDMIRIGLLFANDGVFNGHRILSKAYLEKATDIQYLSNSYEEEDIKEGYGFGFWTIKVKGVKAYMASGYGGQTIAVIPEYELVIVVTHHWRVSGEQAGKQEQVAEDIAVAVWQWAGMQLPEK